MSFPARQEPAWQRAGRGPMSGVDEALVADYGGPDAADLAAALQQLHRSTRSNPCGYEPLTSTGTGDVHRLDVPDAALEAVLFIAGNAVNYRTDGSNPAGGNDQALPAGAYAFLGGEPTMKGFAFCSAVAGNATVFVTYYN